MRRRHPRASRAAACALALLAPHLARADEGGIGRWLNPATAPFIPIPEIDLDPYSGTTLGVIPTALYTNAQDQIVEIAAPDVIRNQYFGWGSRMRIFGFPSADTQWFVIGGGKQRVEREFDARYTTGQTRLGSLSWSVEAIYDRSGTPRFFGLGNHSLTALQTTYLDNQARLDAQAGYNFDPVVQLAYFVRLRYVDVLPGVLPGLPSIGTVFPGLPGIGAEHELQQRLILTRDTRDSAVIPQKGQRYLAYAGFVSRALGSSVSYSFVGGEVRGYLPFGDGGTLAWHAAARYMPAARAAPFWALSSLGGDRSIPGESEPLRSDGAGRYLDANLFAAGAELRVHAASFGAFGTHVSLELGPFVDTGKVFSTSGTSPLSQLHSAIGVGIRGIASPNVVGYLDFGYGPGKSAVFSGINYPF